jgi:IPT/TIG domain
MARLNSMRSGLTVVVFVHALMGCSAEPVPPTAPSTLPSALSPTVTAMSVTTGSSKGGTPLRIVGAGFKGGVTVTFGTTTVARHGYDPRVPGAAAGSIIVNTPAHAPGVVDLIVTNTDGGALRLANAYEFVPQESFDFNGTWDGSGSNGNDIVMDFSIRDNLLIAASCAFDTRVTVSLSFTTVGGEFSAESGDFRISGRIVSPSDAIGKITAPPCGVDGPWVAHRLPR